MLGRQVGKGLYQPLPNLWVLRPPLPVPNRWLRRYLYTFHQRYQRWYIRQAQEYLDMDSPVLWTYSPLAVDHLGHLGEQLVCYDCVDDYLTLPYYRMTGAGVAAKERVLLGRADIIFFTTDDLRRIKGVSGTHVHIVGNAADIALFETARTREWPYPPDMARAPRPILGFYGNLVDLKVNFDLLEAVATMHPEWSLVLIGPAKDSTHIERLRKMPNVYFLGWKPQEELPAYLHHFNVCLIPYRVNEYTVRSYPLKLHEYFAAGKPVVATDLPCFREFVPLVLLARDYDEFCGQIEYVLENDQGMLAERRVEVARLHSWQGKAAQMLTLIQAHLKMGESSKLPGPRGA